MRARRGDRGRRPAPRRARARRGRPRPRAAARAPGRRARRHGADARQPARGAAQEPAAIGVLRADGDRILTPRSAPTSAAARSATSPAAGLAVRYATRRRVATLEPTPNGAAIHELAFSPDGAAWPSPTRSRRAIPTRRGRRIGWRCSTRAPIGPWRACAAADQPITGLRFSPDGRTHRRHGVSASPRERRVHALRRADRAVAPPVPCASTGAAIAAADDQRRRAPDGGRRDDGVTVRDAATLAVLERRCAGSALADGFAARFQTVSPPYALSGDDRTMAIGGTDGSLRLLDLETGGVRAASGAATPPPSPTRASAPTAARWSAPATTAT